MSSFSKNKSWIWAGKIQERRGGPGHSRRKVSEAKSLQCVTQNREQVVGARVP